MEAVEAFWNLGGHSDREVIDGLGTRVGSGRQLMAEVLAHLGEVEERRLHLLAGYGSMFAYCVSRLGMSEDEACRRIDVARLARRFPSLFPRLATGQISLSVAALLKPHLALERGSHERQSNMSAIGDVDVLIAAVAGKTVQQAREALAALFPRPDVDSSIRKLPQRQREASAGPAALERSADASATASHAPAPRHETLDTDRGDAGSRPATHERTAIADGVSTSAERVAPALIALQLDRMSAPASLVPVLQVPSVDSVANTMRPSTSPTGSPAHHLAATHPEETLTVQRAPQPFVLEPPRAERLEPLSPGRYRVQFTADAALKEKLELARDLMRHTLPGGDLAAIVARSLDLLIEQLMKRRFGATTRRENQAHRTQCAARQPTTVERPANAEQPADTEKPADTELTARAWRPADAERATSQPGQKRDIGSFQPALNATPAARPREPFEPPEAVNSPNSPPSKPAASSFDRATRRALLERDGLRCTWQSEDGVRCEARAWLEHDHVQPRARGGSSSTNNGRLLCRAHNRLAAGQEFGRQHVERAIAEQRAKRRPFRASP
jgi:hypothetical protein